MKKQKHLAVYALLFVAIIALVFVSVFTIPNAHAVAAEAAPIAIAEGQYDGYTDTDVYIEQYEQNFYRNKSNIIKFGGQLLLSAWGDDGIVNVIPRELFTVDGDYLYIGKEYGFFVKTFPDSYYHTDTKTYETSLHNKHSFVLVFDITNNLKFQNTDTVQITVAPKFQYEFAYLSGQESAFTLNNDSGYDASGYRNRVAYDFSEETFDDCVVPAPRYGSSVVYAQEERYYLKDISFALSLYNEQDYNEGDENYNAIEDEGSYFLNFDYKYAGVKREHGDFPIKETINLSLDVAEMFLGKGFSDVRFIIEKTVNSIKFIEGIHNFANEKDIEYGNGKITATYLQSDLDDHLIKTVGAAINTSNDDSVWYKVGNSCSITAQTTQTAKGSPANYTRLMREIGLSVVDVADDSTVKTAVSGSAVMMHAPVYEALRVDTPADVILLNDGKNYFKFTPKHDSKYRFSFGNNLDYRFKIDGTEVIKDGAGYEKYLVKNRVYEITVEKQGGGANDTLSVTPDRNSTFVLKPRTEYLIRSDLTGIRQLSLSDDAAVFVAVYYGAEVDFGADPTSLNDARTIAVKRAGNEKLYFVVRNDSEEEKTVTLSDGDVAEIAPDVVTELEITKNENFFRFTANENGTYKLLKLDGKAVSGKVYDENYNMISSSETPKYFKFTLNAGETVYFSFSDFSAETPWKLKVRLEKFRFTEIWYVSKNGGAFQRLSGSTVDINRGDTIEFYLMIDDLVRMTPDDSVCFLSEEDVKKNYFTLGEQKFTAASNCLYGEIFMFKVNYSYRLEPIAGIIQADNVANLTISVVPVNSDFIVKTRNDEELGFYWRADLEITALELYVTDGHDFSQYLSAGASSITAIGNRSCYYYSLLPLNYKSYTQKYDFIISFRNIVYQDFYGVTREYFSDQERITLPSLFATSVGNTVEISAQRHFLNMCYTMRDVKQYLQTADITFVSDKANSNPLANQLYINDYNGNHHTLGLYVQRDNERDNWIGGFCGWNMGTLENIDFITFINCGDDCDVGGITGLNGGTIRNCTVETLIATNSNGHPDSQVSLGGVAGANAGTITSVVATPMFQGGYYMGGIAGRTTGGEISHCNVVKDTRPSYSIGFIYVDRYRDVSAGGVVGKAESGSKVANCSASIDIEYTGPASNDTNNLIAPKIGGYIGWLNGGSASGCSFSGTIKTGKLKTLSYGFLGINKFDQRQNVHNTIGYNG